MSSTKYDRLLRLTLLPALSVLSILAGLTLLQRWHGLGIWDDAYMFARYAAHWLAGEGLVWNPGGRPTYGLTSPAYLALVAPLLSIYPDLPARALVVSSLFSAVLAAFFLFLAVIVGSGSRAYLQRWFLALWLALSLCAALSDLSVHATSGMDTMFSLAWAGAYILFLVRLNSLPRISRKQSFALGLLGGAGILIRPDALIFVFVMPFVWFLHPEKRPHAFHVWGGALLVIGIWMAVAYAYFGSALPLPFFAKNVRVYGPEFYGYYEFTSLEYLGAFLQAMWLPVMTLALGLLFARSVLRTLDYIALLAFLIFAAYHVFVVVPIMGFYWRFFVPALPILLVPAARLLLGLLSRVPVSLRDGIAYHPSPSLLIPLLLLPAFLNPQPLLNLVRFEGYASWQYWGEFDLMQLYETGYARHWLHLDTLSGLPDELIIATTEVGMVGVMHPGKRVIDLAGLNEPALAYRFDADRLFSDPSLRPDWIYMPFPHYEAMIQTIEAHPVFQQEYRYYPAEVIKANMGIAIRLNSAYTDRMLQIIEGRL